MTRLQEIPWTEKIAADANVLQTTIGETVPQRFNLYRLHWLRPLLENRWPQLLLRVLTLSGFVFSIVAGLIGSRVGSHNFAIIIIWIAWWTALKLAFIPLGGRSWCSICPIPLPGDWLQQGGILPTRRQRFGLNLRWPKKLRGAWLQAGGFLLIGLFSAVTLTAPQVTSWVLIGLFALAFGLSIVFEHRAFCSYLCPVGGFSGMYAQLSPVEVRVIDKEICAKHEVKSCYQACPWGLYPLAFRDSAACGLCMECLRTCPKDNLALNLRPFGADLAVRKSSFHLDKASLALVMLGSVLAFSAVFLGPWGWLKSAAFAIGSQGWLAYALGYLLINLVLLPVLFTLAVWSVEKFTRNWKTLRQAIAAQAQALFPLGLLAWIAFTVAFAFSKLNLIIGVLNDPLGWGWHWLGVIGTPSTLPVSSLMIMVEVGLLAAGLSWSANVTQKLSIEYGKRNTVRSLPVLVFSLVFTVVMMWLLVG